MLHIELAPLCVGLTADHFGGGATSEGGMEATVGWALQWVVSNNANLRASQLNGCVIELTHVRRHLAARTRLCRDWLVCTCI